jgi:hypothetical protein
VSKLNHTQKYQKDTQSVIYTLKQELLSVETTLAEALFLCRNKCQNDPSVLTVQLGVDILSGRYHRFINSSATCFLFYMYLYHMLCVLSISLKLSVRHRTVDNREMNK